MQHRGMIHPSYTDLMEVINQEGDADTPVVQSRYSIVIAASKRARQLIDGARPLIDDTEGEKPLSIAVEELYQGKVKVVNPEDSGDEQ